MRLFIAVELPKAVRNEVGAALKELKMLSSGGNLPCAEFVRLNCVLPDSQVLKEAAAARLLSRSAEIQANWQFCMSRFKPHWLITGLHANTDALFRI